MFNPWKLSHRRALELKWGGSVKMAAAEEEPKPKKLKVEAPRALRWALPDIGWRVTVPAANQGPRGAARPRRWAVASLLAWGPRTGPVARVAARLAATLCPAPDHFGRVAAGSEDAPPPLANQSAGRGCRAGFGRAADATWERARHVGARPRTPRGRPSALGWCDLGAPDPPWAESLAATSSSLGDVKENAQRLLHPGAKTEFLGSFRKGRGRAPRPSFSNIHRTEWWYLWRLSTRDQDPAFEVLRRWHLPERLGKLDFSCFLCTFGSSGDSSAPKICFTCDLMLQLLLTKSYWLKCSFLISIKCSMHIPWWFWNGTFPSLEGRDFSI